MYASFCGEKSIHSCDSSSVRLRAGDAGTGGSVVALGIDSCRDGWGRCCGCWNAIVELVYFGPEDQSNLFSFDGCSPLHQYGAMPAIAPCTLLLLFSPPFTRCSSSRCSSLYRFDGPFDETKLSPTD